MERDAAREWNDYADKIMSEPRKKVREFCRNEGICTRCICRYAVKGGVLCIRCAHYALTVKKSLGSAIMRESEH